MASNNEKIVREIIDLAIKLNISIYEAKRTFYLGKRLILTPQECQNIATNYPFAWHDVYLIFKGE